MKPFILLSLVMFLPLFASAKRVDITIKKDGVTQTATQKKGNFCDYTSGTRFFINEDFSTLDQERIKESEKNLKERMRKLVADEQQKKNLEKLEGEYKAELEKLSNSESPRVTERRIYRFERKVKGVQIHLAQYNESIEKNKRFIALDRRIVGAARMNANQKVTLAKALQEEVRNCNPQPVQKVKASTFKKITDSFLK